MTLKDVEKAARKLVHVGLASLYETEGREVLCVEDLSLIHILHISHSFIVTHSVTFHKSKLKEKTHNFSF